MKKHNQIAIIIAGGDATRWNNYLDVPKHFIEIDGEPILHRTVRLLNEKGFHKDNLFIVSKDDSRYSLPNSTQYIPEFNYEEHADADKFLNNKELWNKKGRTIVFYGDVYFTEKAIDKICDYTNKDWTLFCRPFSSSFTGTGWGECFAQSFYPKDIDKHKKALYTIAELYKNKMIKRCGGWEHYREIAGLTDSPIFSNAPKKHGELNMNGNYHIIDDYTDDFDIPDDYNRFINNFKK